MKKILAIISLAIMFTFPSCKSSSGVAATDNTASDASSGATTSVVKSLPLYNSKPRNIEGSNGSVSMIPKASAFRMSGDYADKVAVSVDAQGNLTYFPAPSDISPVSAPVSLADGWWLNRQGIGSNSVFTKYTFEEYAALPNVPSVAELKAAIIPGARVTEVISLPFTIGEASDSIPAINEFIKNHSHRICQ